MEREKSNFGPEYGVFLAILERLREESGRTQDDVAKAMNRNQSIVSKSERGARRMDIIEVRLYCKGIGIDFLRFAELLEAELAAGSSAARKKKRTY
jgi:transcriptional regulator with XRE-family HTH domain